MKKIIFFLIFSVLLFAKEQKAIILIEGMTCPLCTTAVKKSLKGVDGVSYVKVRLNTKKAIVNFEDSINKKELLKAIEKVGYKGSIELIKDL